MSPLRLFGLERELYVASPQSMLLPKIWLAVSSLRLVCADDIAVTYNTNYDGTLLSTVSTATPGDCRNACKGVSGEYSFPFHLRDRSEVPFLLPLLNPRACKGQCFSTSMCLTARSATSENCSKLNHAPNLRGVESSGAFAPVSGLKTQFSGSTELFQPLVLQAWAQGTVMISRSLITDGWSCRDISHFSAQSQVLFTGRRHFSDQKVCLKGLWILKTFQIPIVHTGIIGPKLNYSIFGGQTQQTFKNLFNFASQI